MWHVFAKDMCACGGQVSRESVGPACLLEMVHSGHPHVTLCTRPFPTFHACLASSHPTL